MKIKLGALEDSNLLHPVVSIPYVQIIAYLLLSNLILMTEKFSL